MFLYKKFLGWVHASRKDQPRQANLLTCRALGMKIPGGSELLGRIQGGEIEIFAERFRGKEIIPTFPDETHNALKVLADALERSTGDQEPLSPITFFDRKNYYEVTQLNTVWIVSFLETSAARSAFQSGLRSGDDTVNWDELTRYQTKQPGVGTPSVW